MTITCPHCHNAIESQSTPVDELVCPTCGSSFRVRDTELTTTAAAQRRLGKFELYERVGVGAFGAVWRARDTELDRIVAVKLLHASLVAEPADRERFFREARAGAQLRHPGIVTVHEVSELDGVPAIVADFVEGLTLRELLQTRRLTFRESAEVIAQVAEALDYAHSLKVVHRDIKPGNVMIEFPRGEGLAASLDPAAASGSRSSASTTRSATSALSSAGRSRPRTLLLDFGLALRDEAEVTLTADGQVIGTPAYMSPEQAAGSSHKVDRRSDIYSLGVVLYELLCGEVPFRGSKVMMVHQVLHEEPRPLRRVNDKILRDLETICLKAMTKEPARRYATARELADDLRRYLTGELIRARPVGTLERVWKWAKRRPAVAALLVVSAVAGLALVGVGVGVFYNARLARAYAAVEASRDLAEHARHAEAEQREKAETYLYFSRIALAEREWSANNVGQAERLLAECPTSLRGWEWHYLKRICRAEVRTLAGHTEEVTCVAYSSDGRRIVTAGVDRSIRIWNAQSGETSRTIATAEVPHCVALSPDARLVAAGYWNPDEERAMELKLWDTATGQPYRALRGHTGSVYGVQFSPDGKTLASAGDDAVRVWDCENGQALRNLRYDRDSFGSLAFSPDGRLIVAGTGKLDIFAAQKQTGRVVIWHAESGQRLHILSGHDGTVTGVAFSPDGQQLASASRDRTIRVWDPQSGRELCVLRGHSDSVQTVAFSHDGRFLISGSNDGSIKVWDIASAIPVRTLRGHTGPVNWVACSPLGNQVASASVDGTAKIWDAGTDADLRTLRLSPVLATSVTFSPDGKQIAATSTDGSMKVFDAITGQEKLALRGHSLRVWRLVFSPDSQRLASCSEDKTAKVWDSATGQELLSLEGHGKWVQDVAFSPDGLRLATASGDLTVKIWDARTRRELLTLVGHRDRVWSVCFSSNGARVATGAGDRTARIWDAHTGREIFTLSGHGDEVACVAFSPDGQRLASACQDRTAKLWDASTGKELLTLLGHTSYLFGVAFSPDGTRLATASFDQTVKVWDLTHGQELLTLRADSGGFHSVTFSPDGRQIAASGYDGTIRIWDATPLADSE